MSKQIFSSSVYRTGNTADACVVSRNRASWRSCPTQVAHSVIVAGQADPSNAETENGCSKREHVGGFGLARTHGYLVKVLGANAQHDDEGDKSGNPRKALVDLTTCGPYRPKVRKSLGKSDGPVS
jgi:hypothetical protein